MPPLAPGFVSFFQNAEQRHAIPLFNETHQPRLRLHAGAFRVWYGGMRKYLLLLVLLAVCLGAPAWAQFGDRVLVTPSLVADTGAVAAGQEFTVGLRLKFAPGWHTYWQFSGDSGAPVKVEWTLPPGFTAGPLQWPIPKAHLDDGDMITFIYDEEVLLLTQITAPAQLPPSEVSLKAEARWLVCEQTCVPGSGTVELKLPVGAAQAANVDLFTRWRAQIPKSTGAPFTAKWDTSKAGEVTLQIAGLAADLQAEFFPLPPAGVKPGHTELSAVAADGSRTFTLPLEEPTPGPWRGVVAVSRADGSREGWEISQPANADAASNKGSTPSRGELPPAQGGLLLKLALAFLGGLIMNVMPCVLPVIALKIFGFVGQAGQEPGRVFKLGLAFTAGVFAFFLMLATIVARLKGAFNWGYQFQNPYLLAGLIALVFVFALNLLGVFEIALSGGTATKLSELSRKEGFGGAFLHGLFTTLLGTSCTAPFLSTSLGFAVTQSTPVIFLLFLAIAAGMSLPYFLLTARPAWLRYVPKPGAWMERAKQFMGFVMLAVAVWLFTVLGLRGAHVVSAMSWFLLVLGLASWGFGVFGQSVAGRLGMLALAAGSYWFLLHGNLGIAMPSRGAEERWKTGGIEWVAYSEERLADARKAGQPVFIDFTAEWCINCKTYERLVLSVDSIGAKFTEKKVLALRADWTNTDDPVVTRALKSFGRIGVPLYVLYRPGEDTPYVTDALTVGSLTSELDKIGTESKK